MRCPLLDQAELVLECRTLLHTDIVPEQFLDPAPLRLYAGNDYHGLFFGEVVAVSGVAKFAR